MFNFCVVSAVHNMINDTGRATTTTTLAGVKSKPHHYKKLQKTKALPKKWVLPKNNLNVSDEKNNKNITLGLYETT